MPQTQDVSADQAALTDLISFLKSIPDCRDRRGERAALKELLSTLDLDGVLIQADALHSTRPFFNGARSRAPTWC